MNIFFISKPGGLNLNFQASGFSLISGFIKSVLAALLCLHPEERDVRCTPSEIQQKDNAGFFQIRRNRLFVLF